jgi:hypothetical protein
MEVALNKNGKHKSIKNSLFYTLCLDMKRNCVRLVGIVYEKVVHSVSGWDGYFL